MLVKEIMTKKVVTINFNDTVFDACLKYRDNKVGCLIVTDKESCVGIVTERDLIERTICEHKDPFETNVGEIMSSNVKTIHPLDNINCYLLAWENTRYSPKIKKCFIIYKC